MIFTTFGADIVRLDIGATSSRADPLEMIQRMHGFAPSTFQIGRDLRKPTIFAV
ncbi:hypothetical protein M2324_002696 [Rhodovulum sulfidophilum]|uniref:hypothetical protein n=1 Tax=Rhodovulum sulfidophilum TaxID=35806 RepID=UPI0012DAB74A|nr:hypothetical protein [Rhodovulum sulfidophilum]MCW2304291.1 hypothetical protein [Rhodovulum sulfidophilum]